MQFAQAEKTPLESAFLNLAFANWSKHWGGTASGKTQRDREEAVETVQEID